jgi:hypothetical protein
LGSREHYEADEVDTARVSVQFIRHTESADLWSQKLPVQKAAVIGQSVDAVRDAGAAVLVKQVAAIGTQPGALSRLALMRQTMNEALYQVRSRVSGVVLAGLDAVNFPLSWARDVSSLVNGIVDLRGYNVATLSADWRSAFTALSTPVKLTPSARQHARDVDIISAHSGMELAVGKADTAQVVLQSEVDTPTMTPVEVQALVNEVRTDLQAVVDQYRTLYELEDSRPVIEALKDTALALQEAGQAVINARPPLISRRVPTLCNHRLLAHQWYGDHTRAAEILRLNSLRQPNFIAQGELLNGYAS